MTGRTHDLAAFTALSFVVTSFPIPHMTLATALVAFSANMIGGLAPDIDQSTGALYRRVRGGQLVSKFIAPLMGGHRFISHSLIGVFIFGFVARQVLNLMHTFVLVDIDIVWWAFMIGFVSHLLTDLLTRDGVPLLFPIPIRFGVPPLRVFRMKTSGFVEKSFVFPILILINIYLYYSHYSTVLKFLKTLLK